MGKPKSPVVYLEDQDTGCWVWQRTTWGGKPSSGLRYGRKRRKGVWYYAHRLYYEDRHGPIPDGMTVDHLCFNRLCVNPGHMELVTLSENARRANVRRAQLKREREAA